MTRLFPVMCRSFLENLHKSVLLWLEAYSLFSCRVKATTRHHELLRCCCSHASITLTWGNSLSAFLKPAQQANLSTYFPYRFSNSGRKSGKVRILVF